MFLEDRVPDHIIAVIRAEKITQNVMAHMEESDLERLFPAMGDRLYFRPILKMFKVSYINKATAGPSMYISC